MEVQIIEVRLYNVNGISGELGALTRIPMCVCGAPGDGVGREKVSLIFSVTLLTVFFCSLKMLIPW